MGECLAHVLLACSGHGGQRRLLDSPVTGVKNGCEPPCGGWESNLGPVNETVTVTTEPSLQSLDSFIFTLKIIYRTLLVETWKLFPNTVAQEAKTVHYVKH